MTASQAPKTAPGTLAAVGLLLAAIGMAGDFEFRVALEDVPGVTEITERRFDDALTTLERELEAGVFDTGYLLATICAAHILDSSLDRAEPWCEQAVSDYPGASAFNNRGVLRALRGDYAGAARDFARVRPDDRQVYMKLLEKRDPGLIADANYRNALSLIRRDAPPGSELTLSGVPGAKVEPIGN